VLFHRYAALHGQLNHIDRLEVLGTDIDKASLAAAELGVFPEAAFEETPAELRERYFSPAIPYTIVPAIRQSVRFRRADLLDEFPTTLRGFQLICCRNVLIYFDRDTQERLLKRFHDALAPGGFLVLGKVETLLGPVRSQFAAVEPRERIFRRA
jgi:chemotaxis methyl-accepting protein methylase